MIELNIQRFGGRGASSGGSKGSGFFGEEKAGASLRSISGNQFKLYAGDYVRRQSDGEQFMVSSAKGNKVELYNGNETFTVKDTLVGYQFEERGQNGNRILAKQRINVLKGGNDKTVINGRNIAIYNKAPKGFVKTSGSITAPKGYEWYSNNKSLFGDERINILVKKKK